MSAKPSDSITKLGPGTRRLIGEMPLIVKAHNEAVTEIDDKIRKKNEEIRKLSNELYDLEAERNKARMYEINKYGLNESKDVSTAELGIIKKLLTSGITPNPGTTINDVLTRFGNSDEELVGNIAKLLGVYDTYEEIGNAYTSIPKRLLLLAILVGFDKSWADVLPMKLLTRDAKSESERLENIKNALADPNNLAKFKKLGKNLTLELIEGGSKLTQALGKVKVEDLKPLYAKYRDIDLDLEILTSTSYTVDEFNEWVSAFLSRINSSERPDEEGRYGRARHDLSEKEAREYAIECTRTWLPEAKRYDLTIDEVIHRFRVLKAEGFDTQFIYDNGLINDDTLLDEDGWELKGIHALQDSKLEERENYLEWLKLTTPGGGKALAEKIQADPKADPNILKHYDRYDDWSGYGYGRNRMRRFDTDKVIPDPIKYVEDTYGIYSLDVLKEWRGYRGPKQSYYGWEDLAKPYIKISQMKEVKR